MKLEGTTKRLLRGALNALTGSVLDKLSQFILSIIVSRCIGTDAFSFYSLLLSYSALIVAISAQATSSVISRNCADKSISGEKKASQVFFGVFIILVSYIIVVVISNLLTIVSNPISGYGQVFQALFYASTLFQCFYVYLTNLNRGFENFSLLRSVIGIKNALNIPIAMLLIYYNKVEYLILYFFISSGVSLYVIIYKTKKICPVSGFRLDKFCREDFFSLEKILFASTPFFVVTITSSFYNYKIKDIIYALNDGHLYLAAYSIVLQFSAIFSLIIGAVGFSSLPIFTESNENIGKLFRIFNRYYQINFIFIVIPMIVFVLFNKYILILYRVEQVVSSFSILLFISSAFSTMVWTVGPLLLAQKSGFIYMFSMLSKIIFTLLSLMYSKQFILFTDIPLVLLASDFIAQIFYCINLYIKYRRFLYNFYSIFINFSFFSFFYIFYSYKLGF